MKPVYRFNVVPSLPSALERLRDLAHNLRWAWNHDTIELFRRLDRDLWESVNHNPVLMLGCIHQERLREAAGDDAFLAHLDRVAANLDSYLQGEPNWFRRKFGKSDPPLVAYFSAEFGLTECLSIFAGGLGVLAGDHLKSSSDLGIPLVAVGLLYQQGYFRQYLNASGWQQEAYEDNDFQNLPVTLVRREDGAPLTVSLAWPGRGVTAQIWRAQVGRVALFLLDTNVAANQMKDRAITEQLYGGDTDMRIQQEILLGIGGCRALEVLNVRPTVYHMNEGHSAFLGLERVRRLMQDHALSFAEAREVASAGLIFTTHTPVSAGHDYFPRELMQRYFAGYSRELGLSMEELMALGRENPHNAAEHFCMTVLALKLASSSNAVSKLHGKVSRRMWQTLWPGVPLDEIPIGHVTNGVHFRSWISYEMNQLYDRYLGPNWREEPANGTLWKRAETIPGEELWRTHERRRERLVAFARRRLRAQLQQRGAPPFEVEAAGEVLDPEALTIGFARRFATYKRAALLLHDVDRLAAILANSDRPVQVIVAGKAHPKDEAGKELIAKVVNLARRPEFRRRLVFLENYDMAVARYLVQGSDVWLNTPLRPNEASGTSGMKAAANGALNLSTLDGWWDEAWNSPESRAGLIGWAIGNGEIFPDREYQDRVEAEALYDILEQDVVPAFYERRAGGVPPRWIKRMKAAIAGLCFNFNTHRMVQDYAQRFYLVAHARHCRLAEGGAARAKALAAWCARLEREWPSIRIEVEEAALPAEVRVSSKFPVRARIYLGHLTPDDVHVELFLGRVNAKGEICDPIAHQMEVAESAGAGNYVMEAHAVPCCSSGQYGYTVRVLPYHPDLSTNFRPNLISWAREPAEQA